MHHCRPCLKLRSAILIVLSTVVAKDANHRFQSKWWKKRDRIGGNREAFSSLETLGCVQRSLGCSHGDMSTEFGDEKTCFSPSAASAGPGFPRMVREVVARPLAPLGASPLDAPGSKILEDLESVSTTLFCCSCMDYSFRLLLLSCPCVDLDKHSVFCRFTGTVCTRGTDTFSVLAHSFSPFVSHFDTHFLHLGDSPALCRSTQSYGTHMHAKAEISKQLTRASSSVPVLCDSSTESPAWCSSSQTTELHPSSVF